MKTVYAKLDDEDEIDDASDEFVENEERYTYVAYDPDTPLPSTPPPLSYPPTSKSSPPIARAVNHPATDKSGGSSSFDEDETELKKVERSCAMRAYKRFCYFVPLGLMAFLLLLFFYLVATDRPLALCFLTVYIIHHAWCHLFHVSVFSLVGQVTNLLASICSRHPPKSQY